MRISDWSSDVCSSDLFLLAQRQILARYAGSLVLALLLETGSRDRRANLNTLGDSFLGPLYEAIPVFLLGEPGFRFDRCRQDVRLRGLELRSEEHTSELQSLMRISYAVFCLKKKRYIKTQHLYNLHT